MLDDAHDESEEMVTLALSNASGAWLQDSEVTGTIENADLMPAVLLARFGRATAEQVVRHIEERRTVPRERGFRVRFAGQELRSGSAGRRVDHRVRKPQPTWWPHPRQDERRRLTARGRPVMWRARAEPQAPPPAAGGSRAWCRAAGIDSPGLTASRAIAERVADLVDGGRRHGAAPPCRAATRARASIRSQIRESGAAAGDRSATMAKARTSTTRRRRIRP